MRGGKNVGVVVLVRLYRVLASLVLELNWRRGDDGGRAPPLEEKFKIVVESRVKFLGWVTRGVESESDVACRGDVGGWAPPLQEKLKWW